MKCSKFLKLLERDGWQKVSVKGSHLKLGYPFKKGTLIFPDHGSRELSKGLENKLRKIAEI